MEPLLDCTSPRVLIISGDDENPEFDLEAFALAHPTLTIFMTGRDGAVTALFEREHTTVLHSHLTRNDQRLRPL